MFYLPELCTRIEHSKFFYSTINRMNETKLCPKCGQILPLENFSKKGKGRCHKCKACQRLYSKDHYSKNKQRHLDKHWRYHKSVIAYIREYKNQTPCMDCKLRFHFSAMDFDHVNGAKKFILSRCHSMPQAKLEMAKCELVCSNCHRLRTWLRTQALSQNRTDMTAIPQPHNKPLYDKGVEEIEGVEPPPTESESAVLPLNHISKLIR